MSAGIPKIREVENFLRRQIFNERAVEGRCNKITIRHFKTGGRSDQVEAIEVPEGVTEDWLNQALNTLEAICTADAASVTGVQTYGLIAYFEKSGDTSIASMRFRLQIDEDNAFEGGPTEDTSTSGQIAQLQRHLEATQKISALAMSTVMGTLERTVRNLAQQNEELLGQRLEGIKVYEDLLSQRHERELSARQAETKQKLLEELAQTGMVLAPAIANRMLGQKFLPESASTRELAYANWLKSLRPEQLDAMKNTMSPAQFMALIQQLEELKNEENGTQEKAKPL